MENIPPQDFAQDEWKSIQKFAAAAKNLASDLSNVTTGDYWNITSIATAADINIFIYPKEGTFNVMLYILIDIICITITIKVIIISVVLLTIIVLILLLALVCHQYLLCYCEQYHIIIIVLQIRYHE